MDRGSSAQSLVWCFFWWGFFSVRERTVGGEEAGVGLNVMAGRFSALCFVHGFLRFLLV